MPKLLLNLPKQNITQTNLHSYLVGWGSQDIVQYVQYMYNMCIIMHNICTIIYMYNHHVHGLHQPWSACFDESQYPYNQVFVSLEHLLWD